jgi:hypothetical protein
MTRVVAQSGGSAFLIHVGDVEVASGRGVPRARVYDRTRDELFPETYLDSIVKFGYWVDFEGSDEEREGIERVVERLDGSAVPLVGAAKRVRRVDGDTRGEMPEDLVESRRLLSNPTPTAAFHVLSIVPQTAQPCGILRRAPALPTRGRDVYARCARQVIETGSNPRRRRRKWPGDVLAPRARHQEVSPDAPER